MKIGLALSGGGAKGLAHIGVIKALKDLGINIDYIAGTSSGSIIASLYAAGFLPNEILDIAEKNKKVLLDYDRAVPIKLLGSAITQKVSIKGFIKGNRLERLIERYLCLKNIKDISDISMPLAIPVVDLETAEIVYYANCCIKEQKENFNEKVPYNQVAYNSKVYDDKPSYIIGGKLSEIVRASCSFPGVFIPKKIKDKLYIDGGVRVNTPVDILKQMGADKVIAITFDCNKKTKFGIRNIIGISSKAFDILSHECATKEQENADVNVKLCLNNVSLLDFSKPTYLANRGYNVIYRNINEIKRRLGIYS